jgi:hypothetical protein
LRVVSVGFPGALEQRSEVLMIVRGNAELLGNGEGVVIHRERGIAAVLPVLAGMPEPLVPGPPLGDRRVSLALADGVGEVDAANHDDADIDYLDQRDRDSRRVDDHLPVAGARQWLGVQFVVGEQPGRRGLGPGDDGRYQLVAQRPGKRELPDSQPSRFRSHAA